MPARRKSLVISVRRFEFFQPIAVLAAARYCGAASVVSIDGVTEDPGGEHTLVSGSHLAENPYHADCLRLIRKLQTAPDRTLPHSVLLKRIKMNAKAFYERQSETFYIESTTR